jgi:hypothetical protein
MGPAVVAANRRFPGNRLSGGGDRIAVVARGAGSLRLNRDLRGMMPMRRPMGGPCDGWSGENR